VVRATGGLDDTVMDELSMAGRGTGFKFADYTDDALVEALESALKRYRDQELWRALMVRSMSEDYSWDRAAAAYAEIYRQAVGLAAGAKAGAAGSSAWGKRVSSRLLRSRNMRRVLSKPSCQPARLRRLAALASNWMLELASLINLAKKAATSPDWALWGISQPSRRPGGVPAGPAGVALVPAAKPTACR
jgi:hypothetical protein